MPLLPRSPDRYVKNMIGDYSNYNTRASEAMMYEQMRNQMRYDMQKEMGHMMHQMQWQMAPFNQTTQAGTVEVSSKPAKDRKRLDNLIAYYYHQRK